MEEEEEYYSSVKEKILSGNIEDVFLKLQKKLDCKVQEDIAQQKDSVYFEFANALLIKCVYLAKSELYESDNCLSQLCHIVISCCRLVKNVDGVEAFAYHRVVYHLFSFIIDRSLHSEACELAVALWELLIQPGIGRAQEMFSAEKIAVVKNMFALCWNEAIKQQEKDLKMSLRFYTAALMHLYLNQSRKCSIREKMKYLLKSFFSAGVSVQRIDSFVYNICLVALRSHVRFESQLEFVFKDTFNAIYDWLQCRQKFSSTDANACNLSILKLHIEKMFGTMYPSCIGACALLDVIEFVYKLNPLEGFQSPRSDHQNNIVRSWSTVFDDLNVERMFPEFCTLFTLCLNIAASKVSSQKLNSFVSPTPIELLPLFIKIWSFSNEKMDASSAATFANYKAYLRLLFAQIQSEMSLFSDMSEEERGRYSDTCFEVARELTVCLTASNVTAVQKILLAMDLNFFGAFLHNKGLYSMAVPFLEPFCSHVTSCFNNVPFDAQIVGMEESAMLRGYDMLAACYTNCGNLNGAFAVAAQGLAFFGLSVADAFRVWIRIKKSAAKEKHFLAHRTIKRELEFIGIAISTENILQLLKLEFSSYLSNSNCMHFEEDAYEVALDMLPISRDSFGKGTLYLEMTKLALGSKDPSTKMTRNVEDSCQNAITFLQQEMDDEIMAMSAKSHLAIAYFWLYQIQWEKVQKTAVNSGIRKSDCTRTNPQETDAEVLEENCDTEIAYPHVNLAIYVQLHSTLDKAVDLWDTLLALPHVWTPDEISLVKVATEIYVSAQRIQQMVRLQKIILQIGYQQKNADLILYGGSGICLFLTRNGCVAQAKMLLDCIADSAMKCQDFSSGEKEYSFLHFQLVKAEMCLYSSELTTGIKCLMKVLNSMSNVETLKHMVLIEAEARLLKAKFCRISSHLLLTLSEEERSGLVKQSPVMEALDALKMSISSTKRMRDGYITRQKVADWYWYKQLFLNAEMESTVLLGQMYLEIGAPRETCCYLKNGLTVAQEMLLISRGIEILLLLAETELLCNNWNDCMVNLQGAFYMINSKIPEVIAPLPTPTKNDGNSSGGSPWLHAKQPPFFYDDDIDDVFLHRPSTPSKLPSFRRLSCLQHLSNCTCICCQYSSIEMLRVRALWLETLCLARQEEVSDLSLNDIDALLKGFDHKHCLHLEKAYAEVFKTDKLLKIQGMPKPSFESTFSNDFMVLQSEIVMSVAHELASNGKFQKALDLVTLAIQRIEQKSSCRHMLSTVHSHLLVEKVCFLLQQAALLKEKKWFHMLIHYNPLLNQVTPETLSECLNNFHLGTSPPCAKEIVTPNGKVPLISSGVKNPSCRNTVCNAPQKKVPIISNIQNFSEPSPLRPLENVLPDVIKGKTIRNARNSRRGRDNAVRLRNRLKPSDLENVELKGIEMACVVDDSPEILRGRDDCVQRSRKKPGAKVASNSVRKTRSSKAKRRSNSEIESNNSEHETEGIRQSVSSLKAVFQEVQDERIYSKSCSEVSNVLLFNSESEVEDEPEMYVDLDSIEEDLLLAKSFISLYPPCKSFAKISILLSLLLGFKKSDNWERRWNAAFHFSECVGVTLRHQGIICMQKRLRDGLKDGYTCPGDDIKDDVLSFGNCSEPKKISETIPPGWTVVQICGINSASPQNSNHHLNLDLVVCRYRKNSVPLFGYASSTGNQTRLGFLREFHKILDESKASLKTSKADVWWTTRRDLDSRMKILCQSMENVWLGMWKVLFLGTPDDSSYSEKIAKAVSRILHFTNNLGFVCHDEHLLQAVLDARCYLNVQQVTDAVTYLWNVSPSTLANEQLRNFVLQEAQQFEGLAVNRQPVVLILDKHVHQLPWECMPLLQNQTITRVPSLHMLQAQLLSYNIRQDTVFSEGVKPQDTFYVLNTRNDLPHTQRTFEQLFKSLKWTGIVGRNPTSNEMVSAITEYDLFLYCGHGNGSTFLSGSSVERLRSRAAVVLMGCSSGKLRVLGEMEPMGLVQHYWLGGCPMVLANLWDVTDKDIDRFTTHLLRNWLGKNKSSVSKAVAESRQICMLPHLIGCAPVVYGLPVFSNGKIAFPD